ncbi:MAG: Uma2 family endonuclease [Okeania sp. SIO3B5]|uniref:Uma2 family endonuclease n=1 Tax=Okeania sp. SIO3B5 TaxID=2607811 RepID=UPI001401BB14|nr:Uma2 family endonuclease [Okeania sp. SIO3B5]NEO57970.1 Uma2 family endonuclease [Okeania sp. SIO3B5]
MVQELITDTKPEIIYPESDCQPMADNTKQFRWIVTIKENLEILFAEVVDVFVAGDFLWYPVVGNNKIRTAPDIMVVFGRPKGDRGSYKQWEEENIAPQVVFEILSPGNRLKEMNKKLLFYQQHGVEEYYIYDPDKIDFTGLIRVDDPASPGSDRLETIEKIDGWVSPRLNIRFQITENTLEIYRPDGRKFLTSIELERLREQEYQRAEQEKQRAEQEKQRAEQEKQRADRLAAILRERGIDPDKL